MTFTNNPFFVTNLAKTLMKENTCHNKQGFPFYNIAPVFTEGEDNPSGFDIEFAVAGYKDKELKVSLDKNVLTVESNLKDTEKECRTFWHNGITKGRFRKEFALPEYYFVEKVTLKNGILKINVLQDTPEEVKPKVFDIK